MVRLQRLTRTFQTRRSSYRRLCRSDAVSYACVATPRRTYSCTSVRQRQTTCIQWPTEGCGNCRCVYNCPVLAVSMVFDDIKRWSWPLTSAASFILGLGLALPEYVQRRSVLLFIIKREGTEQLKFIGRSFCFFGMYLPI